MAAALARLDDISWAPTPNTLTINAGVPANATVPVTSVIALVRDRSGDILLTEVADRGWDLPGGHLEAGETPREAIVRELAEETGLIVTDPTALEVIGWQHLHVHAPAPDGYRYPHPDSYQLVYGLTVPRTRPPVAPAAGTECTTATWVTAADAAHQLAGRTWHAFLGTGNSS